MSSIITSALTGQQPAPLKRSRRRRRWIVIGLLLYTVLGFLVAPAIIKWQLHEQLPALTHRQVVVESVRVNPYALSLTVRGLSLTETNGAAFAGFDELYVNFQLSSLFRWTWTFSEIKLTGPTATVVRLAGGQFNFSNLLTDDTSSTASTAPPPVLIQQLIITNALLTFTDHTTPTPFRTVYGPTHVALENLSTRPNQHGPYSILARTDEGESLAWSGTLSLHPPQSRGEFKLLNIPPAKYGPYLAHFTTMRVVRGSLDVSAAYDIKAASFPPQVEVSNVVVRLRDFLVKSPDADETLLSLNEFLVQNASANLTGATVRVPLVKLSGGSAFIRREADGRLEAEKFVQPPTNSFLLIRQLASRLQAAVTAELQASLDEFRVEDFSVTAEDRSLPSVGRLGLDHLNVSVKGVSNQTNEPITVSWDVDWRGGGHIQVSSRGTLLPLAAQADVIVSNLALPPLQPYVEQQAHLAVQSGELSVSGQVQFDPHATERPMLRFHGDVGVTNFLTADTIAYHEFVRWDNLGVRGIQFELEPNRLDIDEVKFTGLHASLAISTNGQLAVLALQKQPPTSGEPATASAPATDAMSFPIKLGALVFEHGSFGAADESLASRFSTRIEEFDGSVRDITFPGLTRATVDLRGKVSALAPFAVTGSLTPNLTNPFVDLKITFTNTDLTPFTPYTEKFAGYPLNKGKLTFDVQYKIEDRVVNGRNVLAIDQLTFGAHNNSPDATTLPVKLGVALLKDRNGRIDLDVPVSGSLDDPNFQIRGVVWNVIVNILIKAATSPFSLLGALVGGGEELQYVEFDPGLAVLNAGQTNKLTKLASALHERPALNLEIGATYDAQRDVAALGRQKVQAKMRTLRIQEIVARGRPAPPAGEIVLDEDEYEGLLRKSYREAFNTTPEQALREAFAASIATNAPGADITTAVAAKDRQPVKGATALARPGTSLSDLRQQAAGTAAAPGGEGKPLTERELVRSEMEQRLLTTMPVNEEDLNTLLQRRIEAVQAFLISVNNVEAGRVFLVAPRATETVKGEARVTFTLN